MYVESCQTEFPCFYFILNDVLPCCDLITENNVFKLAFPKFDLDYRNYYIF